MPRTNQGIMKTMHLVPLLSALMLTSAFAQDRRGTDATDEHRSIPVSAPGDGFIMRGTEALVIRNGVASRILTEVVLPNGLRVQANGDVTLRTGDSSALRTDQLLTPEGVFVPLPVVVREVVPLSSSQVKSTDKEIVNFPDRDVGFTISWNRRPHYSQWSHGESEVGSQTSQWRRRQVRWHVEDG